MKFSEAWLRTLIDPRMSSMELAHVLTMAGLEVEAREPVAPAFDGVRVGHVIEIEPHPNADRLRVCEVDTGESTLRIVCGAPNVAPGMRVACALVGARLPGLTVTRATVRGIESSGMLCSARELGLGDDHGGVLALDPDAPVGADLRAYLDLDDHVFTLKLTPNRGDCLSLWGLARELAALLGESVTLEEPRPTPAQNDVERGVRLQAGDACPHYCGRVVRGVDVAAPTPRWIVTRLERCGVRPISCVVDVTNYVMLELGQPLHAFDLDRMSGDVQVRFARPGDSLRLLNGSMVELTGAHLVIADEAGPLALAGVMGGEHSSVTDATQSVFLESAYFSPEAVARASRGLEIASDAAHRFERGVDFAIARQALERATALILDVCGGSAGPVTEALGKLPARDPIMLRPERVNRILGIDVDADSISTLLARFGMQVAPAAGGAMVTPPSFRFDLAIEEDLVEEVARAYGYEHITPTLPRAQTSLLAVREAAASALDLKRALAARDYFEVITFSFVDRQLESDFAGADDPVALANPISNQMSVMRTSLLGSLVECVCFNVARKQDRVRVFEIAGCYLRDGVDLRQVERMAGLSYGAAHPEQWGDSPRDVDFFDVRGDLEAICGPGRLEFLPGEHPAYHPGQSARVHCDGQPVGWIGALHPRLRQRYELPGALVGFELDVAAIVQRALPEYRGLPRVLPVRRDLAVVVDVAVSSESLRASIVASGGSRIAAVVLFDVYTGKGIAEGRKSLAFRVLLQDTEKTLTDAEVEEVMQGIVKVLKEKHDATLRI